MALLFCFKERIEKFKEDLEQYMRQVEELQTYGDINELQRYQKKAHMLDSKLDQAMNRIDQFNEEEKAYKWEESFFPMRKQVSILCSLTSELGCVSTLCTLFL